MSKHGTLLPIPDDPFFAEIIAAWPDVFGGYAGGFPRSAWLHDFEARLREHYPQSSSADRKLTARHYAPFPLRDGPNVP